MELAEDAMNTEQFWSMIDDARRQSQGNTEKQYQLLAEALFHLPAEDIQEFDHILWRNMARAYRADLWDAVWLVACMCSDDAFEGFQSWLIAQGQIVFESVLADPENLAETVDKTRRLDIFNGHVLSSAKDAYKQKTGKRIPESGYVEKVTLVGERAGSESEMRAKFPRIIAKIGGCEDEDWLD